MPDPDGTQEGVTKPAAPAGTEEENKEAVATEQEETATPAAVEGAEAPTEDTPAPDDRPQVNYAMEALRKANENAEILRRMEQNLQQLPLQTQQQQQQYSEADLTAFLYSPDTDPQSRRWAAAELERVRDKKQRDMLKEFTDTQRSASEKEVKKREAEAYVVNSYPNAFVKDNTGNILGWNNNDPIVREAFTILQTDERFKNAPDGLAGAFDIAYGRLARKGQVNLSKQVNDTAAQLRREQKKNLLPAGGGNQPAKESSSETKIQKLTQEYSKTGNRAIFKEILRLRGLNPHEPSG